MLILWRAFDQRLLIGDDIVVTVVAVRGHKVAIGIDAPKSVRVDREEVRRQREAERQDA